MTQIWHTNTDYYYININKKWNKKAAFPHYDLSLSSCPPKILNLFHFKCEIKNMHTIEQQLLRKLIY